jgi:hypothetical protein
MPIDIHTTCSAFTNHSFIQQCMLTSVLESARRHVHEYMIMHGCEQHLRPLCYASPTHQKAQSLSASFASALQG